jgi:hypothetical protein
MAAAQRAWTIMKGECAHEDADISQTHTEHELLVEVDIIVSGQE